MKILKKKKRKEEPKIVISSGTSEIKDGQEKLTEGLEDLDHHRVGSELYHDPFPG